jgi:hypothetical protein
MTGAINNLAASLSGAPVAAANSQNKKVRDDATKYSKRRGIHDAYEKSVTQTEATEAIRKLADADQEEAREDRQEHQIGYTKSGQQRNKQTPGLDLNA